MPKYVISKTLTNPEWNNTTVLSGDLVDEVTKLKQRFEGDIVVHGSPQLAQALIEHDLVDALHLQVYPVIVGAGKRLFSETSTTKRLRLAEARTVGDVHLLNYERAERLDHPASTAARPEHPRRRAPRDPSGVAWGGCVELGPPPGRDDFPRPRASRHT